MPEPTRATRNLRADITHAHQQLQRARLDGGCAIRFWKNRTDELLDRLLEKRSDQVELI